MLYSYARSSDLFWSFSCNTSFDICFMLCGELIPSSGCLKIQYGAKFPSNKPPPFPLSPLSKGFEINKPLEGLIEDLRYPRNKKNIPDGYTDTADIFQVKFGRCFNCRHHEKRIIVRRPLSSKTIDEVARQTKKLKLNVEIRKKVTPIFCCFSFSTVTGNWLESGKPHQSSFQ